MAKISSDNLHRNMNLLGFEPTTVELRGKFYPALRIGQSLFVNLTTGNVDENRMAFLASEVLNTLAKFAADMLSVSGYELRHIDEFKE